MAPLPPPVTVVASLTECNEPGCEIDFEIHLTKEGEKKEDEKFKLNERQVEFESKQLKLAF